MIGHALSKAIGIILLGGLLTAIVAVAATAQLTEVLEAYDVAVTAVALTPDGETLLTGSESGELTLWQGTLFRQRTALASSRAARINDIAVSPNGELAAVARDDRRVDLYSLPSGTLIGSLDAPIGAVKSIAFDPEGKRLVCGSDHKRVLIWDVETRVPIGEVRETMNWVTAVAVSPSGEALATGTMGWIAVWRLGDGQRIAESELHTSTVNTMVYSPDGRFVASGSADKRIYLTETATMGSLLLPTERTGYVWSLAFFPDGVHLLSGEQPTSPEWQDRRLRVWSTWDRSLVATLAGGHRRAAAVLAVAVVQKADGSVLAVSGGSDGRVCAWDVTDLVD
jgi:WD40 repeat protein